MGLTPLRWQRRLILFNCSAQRCEPNSSKTQWFDRSKFIHLHKEQ